MPGTRNPSYPGPRLAAIASASGLGTAIGALGGSLTQSYGDWWFFAGMMPYVIVVGVVTNQAIFRLLDSESVFVQQIVAQWKRDVFQRTRISLLST